MSSLVKINNKNLQVKEFNNQRVVTFKDIDMLHQRVEGTAGRNFRENRKQFIDTVDYFEVTPKDFQSDEIRRLGIESPRGGILITESGYLMLVKSLQDDLAWKVQRELVNNYFRVKEASQNISQLSPELQMFKQIFDTVAKQELKQKEIEKVITETKEEIEVIRDVITINPKAEWRKETNRVLNAIGREIGDYKLPKDQVYNALKETAHCRPTVLVNNLKKRAEANGMAQSKVEKLNILDVLENEPRLKEIYINIVKQMAIKNNISWRGTNEGMHSM